MAAVPARWWKVEMRAFAIFFSFLFFLSVAVLGAEEYAIIYGVTVDSQDNVIGDVKVELLKREGNEDRLVQTTISRGKRSIYYDGMFIFKGLSAGFYTLRISKYGYEEVTVGVEVKPGDILFKRVSLRERKVEYGKVSGKVIAKSLALEGITVELSDEKAEKVLISQETNSKGEFTFEKVEPGKYKIVVRYRGKELAKEDLEVANKQQVRREFRLPDETLDFFYGEIEGSVKDEEGKPVRGAVVEITKAPEGQDLKKVTTDTSGNFVIPLLKPGSYKLRASFADKEPDEESVTVTAGKKKTVNFRLRKKR